MKTIVFIGCKKFGTSREALTVAREMGYYVVLFTDKSSFVHMNEELREVNQIILMTNLLDESGVIKEITKLKEEEKQIDACVSFIDPYVSYAARLSKKFCFTQISEEALLLMENKITIRERLNNLPITPHYTVFFPEESLKEFEKKCRITYPLIIKPPISNGSKDVIYVESLDKFATTLKILHQKYPNSPLLIEEFLLGPQYLLEILVYNNEIKVVGVIEQEIFYNGRFIVHGYKFPAVLNTREYLNLHECVLSTVKQMGLHNGSCHLEMKFVHGKWKLIEINPRMSGGVMNRIIEEGTGINLVKEILKVNLGEEPTLVETKKIYVYARYLTIGSKGKLLKVTGQELALMHEGVKCVYIKPLKGAILTKPYSMGNRYGCVIATSESEEQAKEIALAAAREIKFYLEPF